MATHSLDTTTVVGMATPNAIASVATVMLSLDTIASVGMATPGPECHHHHPGGHSNHVDMAESARQGYHGNGTRHHSPVVTYLCGERDTQQEAHHSHP